MMKNVNESLAGRIGMLILPGMSLRELLGVSFYEPFIPTDDYFAGRKKEAAPVSYADIWRMIQRGSMPELCANPDFERLTICLTSA